MGIFVMGFFVVGFFAVGLPIVGIVSEVAGSILLGVGISGYPVFDVVTVAKEKNVDVTIAFDKDDDAFTIVFIIVGNVVVGIATGLFNLSVFNFKLDTVHPAACIVVCNIELLDKRFTDVLFDNTKAVEGNTATIFSSIS